MHQPKERNIRPIITTLTEGKFGLKKKQRVNNNHKVQFDSYRRLIVLKPQSWYIYNNGETLQLIDWKKESLIKKTE